MKKLVTLLVVMGLFGSMSFVTKPQSHNRYCDRYLRYAEVYLNRADDCQEVGEGIFNQMDKAAEYYRDGECKKGDAMMRAATNAVNAKAAKAQRDYRRAIENRDFRSCAYRNYRNLRAAQSYLRRYSQCASARCR